MLRTITHRAVKRKYSALPDSERTSPSGSISYPAIAFVRSGTASQIRYGFQAFDGSGKWYKTTYNTTFYRLNIESYADYQNGENRQEYSYFRDTFVYNVSPVFHRIITKTTSNPSTGSVTQTSQYVAGLASDESYLKWWIPSNQKVYFDDNGNSKTIGSIHVFSTQSERDTLTDPNYFFYDPSDPNPSGMIKQRPIDTTKVTIVETPTKRESITDREIEAWQEWTFSPQSSGIHYKRKITEYQELGDRYYDSEWVSIANGKISSYSLETQTTIVGSSSVSGTPDAPVLIVNGSQYRVEAAIPPFEGVGRFYLEWVIEDQDGDKQTRGEWVSPNQGETLIKSNTHKFFPNKTSGEWSIKVARAIFYSPEIEAITQHDRRDSRPITYRHRNAYYSVLEAPPYLKNRINWSLFASTVQDSDENFSNARRWTLKAPSQQKSDEAFHNANKWNLGASSLVNSDESFNNSTGWSLSGSDKTESDETFSNRTGWNLFSS